MFKICSKLTEQQQVNCNINFKRYEKESLQIQLKILLIFTQKSVKESETSKLHQHEISSGFHN